MLVIVLSSPSGILALVIYDMIVIGGGALGTCIARDAALRGLTVALFEQEDFGAGATSRGSRVLSAGLRALETLDFTRVREELRERETLQHIAPHLIQPLSCLIPFYETSLLAQTRLRASLALTDALGFDRSLSLHQILSAAEARQREPSLKATGLSGAALVWEAHMPRVERWALENALDARAHGSLLMTHTRVDALRHWPSAKGMERVGGVRWTGQLTGETGETEAHLVVNASGAALPELDRRLPELQAVFGMRRRYISAAVAPLSGGQDAVLLPREGSGSHLFLIPWESLAWAGSLETPVQLENAETAYPTAREVAALLVQFRQYLPETDWDCPALALAAVGISPPFPGPPALPDTHLPLLLDHASQASRLEGLLSVAGGSLLSCRSQAEAVVDLACRKLGRSLSTPPCRTATTPLPGAMGKRNVFENLPDEEAKLRAAVLTAIAEEECLTINDFLMRRTPLFWSKDQGQALVPIILEVMAKQLGWGEDRRRAEEKAWQAASALTQTFRVM